VQDEITAAIATAIAPAIINAEQQRVLGKSPERLDAWEAYHRGMWHFSKGSDNVSTARDFFQKSVNLDPNFAAAYAALAGSVESGEVELAPCLRPLAQTARAVFPQAAFLRGRLVA
jgi:hypothetical protein